MVFNIADDSKNLVFRKQSSSVKYEQEQYYLFFKSKYSNNYLTNITNLFPVFTKPLVTTLCKVINDWSDTIDVTNKGTRVQEDGAEYIYYRQ